MLPDPADYLAPCRVIDFHDPAVAALARDLAATAVNTSDVDNTDVVSTTRHCFEFVRDQIRHSGDHQLSPTTCRASDVLRHRTGYCYAKSHLLCALLRANRIPAGLCYQRLSISGDAPPCCLHGLNAVHLPDVGWYRLDPRGNRPGIDAQFTPPHETLAFKPTLPDERDLPEIHVVPLPVVVDCLTAHPTWDAVAANLPDAPGS